MTRYKFFVLMTTVVLLTTMFSGCLSTEDAEGVTILRIFHHGSVAKAIENLEKKYENTHEDLDVRRERSPSSEAIRKVTDLGRSGDIVMSGDYNLIKEMMLPDDASWWIRYSNNQISLAYKTDSKYSSTLTSGNWFDILKKDDVRFGIADPNVGPDGYRALIAIMLAEVSTPSPSLFDEIIGKNSAIRSTDTGGGNHRIECPEDLAPDNNRMLVRHTPVALLPLLETGEIDYAFQYYSDARTYADNNPEIKVLQLDGAVNLGDSEHLASYQKITIVQYSDVLNKATEVTGDLIANGFTIPKNAENTKDAIEYLRLLLGPVGKEELTKIYIIPMDKAETNDKEALPKELRDFVK